MECCVCYNNIKKSSITCHSICKKCCKKIKDEKCPLCRNKMNYNNEDEINIIEVETCYGSKKIILKKNLKRFIFGNEFKKHLTNILSRWVVSYKNDFVIIDYKKYDYDEILDFKTYSKYNRLNTKYNLSNSWGFNFLIDKLIDRQNIYRLTKEDLFFIQNTVIRDEFECNEKRILKYIWDKEKYKYKLIETT